MGTVFLCLFWLFIPRDLDANDSTAGVTTGNYLTPLKNDAIFMQSEDLTLSPYEIEVAYEFFNSADKDIQTPVVFPLPSVTYHSEGDMALDIHDADPLKFSLWVNGVAAKTRIEKKLHHDENGAAGTMHLQYAWDQTFPKQKTTRIKHHYRSGAGTVIVDAAHEGTLAQVNARYCLGESLMNQLKKKKQFAGHDVRYVLKTGANWKGGKIETFVLRLKKPSPQWQVSLCWKAKIRKVDNVRFQSVIQDFSPTEDLEVLFIEPLPEL